MNISATILIIILTCIISYYALNNGAVFEKLKHYPYQEARDKSFSRWLSAGFLHGSFVHLLINMYVLYQFGEYVESYIVSIYEPAMGRTIFILAYIAMIILANIPTYLKNKDNPRFASIGASGAVSGILFMFIMLSPWSMLYLMLVIPCPAIVAGILYLIYSSWAARQQRDGIDHVAHFYGALSGILLMIILSPQSVGYFIQNLLDVPFL